MIEYKVLEVEQEILNEDLNRLAKEGWRIICSCGKKNMQIILKRKVRIEE